MIGRLFRSSALTRTHAARHSSTGGAAAAAGASSDGAWYAPVLAAGGAALLAAVVLGEERRAEACGIVGTVSSADTSAAAFLLEGLTILQNRGYDSAGMATAKGAGTTGPIVATKFASVGGTADSIHLLRESEDQHKGNCVGIAHTRWATHGGKTDANSHPHLDMRDRIAVVHNGTITNYAEVKKQLQDEGITFRSQTDTEVIAQLIGHIIASENCDVLTAVNQAMTCFEGTWGICVMDREAPGKVVVARNGSPLVLGYGSDAMYIASETAAFSRHTKRFVSLQDGETAVVSATGAELNPSYEADSAGGTSPTLMRFPTSRVEKAPDVKILVSPAPYPHWTIREIMEQPKALAAALGYGGRVSDDMVFLGGLQENAERMLSIQDLLIAACGTSLNAGLYGAKLMRSLGSFRTVTTIDAAGATSCDLPREGGGLLVVSQSGETKDVHRVLMLAKGLKDGNVPMLSVVNAVGSLIARTTKCGVYTHAGRENAVASTKAFVTQVTVMGLIACWFAQNREGTDRAKMDELVQSMHRLPIVAGMALRTREDCARVAKSLLKAEHCFVLGKGYAEPIAYEGALKIKEITYLHAEGYSGGALKHGPFALIEDHKGEFGATPIIMIVLDDEHMTHMKTACEETRARGARTIVITDNPAMVQGVADDIIVIPNNGPLTALLASIPLQLIAYELACLRGINPDVPRNLAKAVTVD